MSTTEIADKIAKLQQRVRIASKKSEGKVRILAVSKTQDQGAIRAAHRCGLNDFGENYLNEALTKIEQLRDLGLCWHFIGPVQSNKTRAIAEQFDWVHSVDREKIGRRLSEQRPAHLPALQVCLQVNISGEASKSGATLSELSSLAEQISSLPHLTLRGLMAIPAPEPDPQRQRAVFASLKAAFSELQPLYPAMDTLSMGMSGDLEAAIEEGSTLVRVGTGIFGPRKK